MRESRSLQHRRRTARFNRARTVIIAPSCGSAPVGRVFFGWKVVAVGFVVAVFGWGLGFYGPGVYLAVLHTLHGWPISLVSGAITVYYLTGATLVIFTGDAFDRFGPRLVVLGAMAALGTGVLIIARVTEPWQLFLGFLVLAVGWAGTSGAAVNAIVAPWFNRRRGLALSLALNGASCGGAVMVPVWVALIGGIGLSLAAVVVVAVMLLTLGPLSVRYLHRGPAAVGLAPDGDAPDPQATVVRAAGQSSGSAPPLSRALLLRSARFWTVASAFALALFAQVGFLTHQLAYLTPALGPDGAALAVTLTTVAAVAGRILAGLIVDRVDRRLASAVNFLLQAVGVTVLIGASSPLGLYAGCLLFGLGVGNVISFPALIVQRQYPAQAFNRVVSLIVAITQFTFAFAPGMLGWTRDLLGSYTLALALCVACQVLAATIVLIRPRR